MKNFGPLSGLRSLTSDHKSDTTDIDLSRKPTKVLQTLTMARCFTGQVSYNCLC